MYRSAYSQQKKKKKRFYSAKKILLVIVVVSFAFLIWWNFVRDKLPSSYPNDSGMDCGTSCSWIDSKKQPQFNKSQYSVNNPASIWVIVNKGRVLPSGYIPADLVVPAIPLRLSATAQEMHLSVEASNALEKMSADANKEGLHLMLASGYRSYSTQVAVYNSEVKSYGQAKADRESARPGHSEHQSGLAADLEPSSRTCEVAQCFANTAEGKWLAANSYKYGFVIRYPQDKEANTGYMYEPWHVRYVGTTLAQQLHNANQTLEQFFGLPSFADYPATSYQLKSSN